ncbi:SelB C-terminal domain-containing protein [Brevibacterium sp. BRM-1]|uniref:selenocysteine-specific translation elongation factor n=1 Tax=Brevibacterium sp. BRM-1 TaxID=2999062 RepID=UPI00227D9A85|nr:selenocysteine-specific translation elongation factor [Brevibacterium sp. BRM-1]WAL39609.1 SelB C-terminal domain-containing protein [Brevibacterium sp. BRM-1]
MSRFVVATAGHVDHGKSTLVKALTGLETDRWEEERRRGLTIDLGFAWTQLPSGREVAFVDVPGHERFLGNMLAGLGPAPVVCFVVAVDEGWRAQSTDHRDALAALSIEHGIIALTRADRAPDRVEEVEAEVRAHLAGTGLAAAPAVAVAAPTGAGLADFTAALDTVLARAPQPDPRARLRLWIDRSFPISGAGTVVTGTLAAGSLAVGERLEIAAAGDLLTAEVRGLQSEDRPAQRLEPVVRAAVNMRGITAGALSRGDALLTPGAWPLVEVVDVRRRTGEDLGSAPRELTAHVGTASAAVHVRPFDSEHARLAFAHPLPLQVGDRIVLRGSGEHMVFGGAEILDIDPPALNRRGAGTRRAREVAAYPWGGSALVEVARRGAMEGAALARAGITVPSPLPHGLRREGAWLVSQERFEAWAADVRERAAREHRDDPLSAGLPAGAAVSALGLPAADLLNPVLRAAGLAQAGGRIVDPGRAAGLGAAEAGLARLERHLAAQPFRAPEAEDLAAWGLGPRELAAAARVGRILRLPDGVVLLPPAPAQAMRVLSRLGQPFTASQARQALETTRRVAIPLLEHLDAKGWTRRVDGSRREVVR